LKKKIANTSDIDTLHDEEKWRCSLADVQAPSTPPGSDHDSDVISDEFCHSESTSRSSASLAGISDEQIDFLEKMIDNDDWEVLALTSSRYQNQEHSSSDTSASGGNHLVERPRLHLSIFPHEHENMQTIDELIEEGNWEALAKVAAALHTQGTDESNNIHEPSSASHSPNSYRPEGDNVVEGISFSELHSASIRRNTKRMVEAEVAAEWAISRGLSYLEGREKDTAEGLSIQSDSEV